MILNERESRHEHVLHVARQMMTAARTAPKGKGVDIIEIAMVTDGNINILSEMMVKMVAEYGMKFFLRDAENILNAECVLLIGTHEQAQGLNCGHCGYATCVSRKEGVPCAINSVDVGIAIGSACATAADNRVDTRVMFSAGLAAQRLNWLEGCTQVYASLSVHPLKILSLTGNLKNKFLYYRGYTIFFIRKGDVVGVLTDYFLSIGHCYPQSGILYHRKIVKTITNGNHFFFCHTDFF